MVILLDKHKKPAGFITESHLRRLCNQRRAVIYRVFPCVVILKDKTVEDMKELLTYHIKIKPGTKSTGFAIVCNETNEIVLFMQIKHCGEQIRQKLETRQQARKNRRSRKTRYRRCKYKTGRTYDCPKKEWMPPSVKSTADNIFNWVKRLKRYINLTKCSIETERFDAKLINNPDIEQVKYEQGTPFGYEVKEYLLDKYGHICQYCGGNTGDNILEWEHIVPKSQGGDNSVKNATISCKTCNHEKGNKNPEQWLTSIQCKTVKTDLDKARIKNIFKILQQRVIVPNRYCTWTNSKRYYIEKKLFHMFQDVEYSSRGHTKYNRNILAHHNDHSYAALCVGTIPKERYINKTNNFILIVEAKGRGSRLRGNINKCGIIITKYRNNSKTHNGFMSGDIVRAKIPKGKYKGEHTGRITIRHRNTFIIMTNDKKRFDANCTHMNMIQKSDGYSYHYERRLA